MVPLWVSVRDLRFRVYLMGSYKWCFKLRNQKIKPLVPRIATHELPSKGPIENRVWGSGFRVSGSTVSPRHALKT